jgi:hypothetical protein
LKLAAAAPVALLPKPAAPDAIDMKHRREYADDDDDASLQSDLVAGAAKARYMGFLKICVLQQHTESFFSRRLQPSPCSSNQRARLHQQMVLNLLHL